MTRVKSIPGEDDDQEPLGSGRLSRDLKRHHENATQTSYVLKCAKGAAAVRARKRPVSLPALKFMEDKPCGE